MIRISNRLTAAASMVSRGSILADVGTDHGYVPIYLVEKGIIPGAIAMDINRGPLERAKEHIGQYGMEAYIQTRLSDGVEALAVGEADSVLIAGMGGGLVMHILTEGAEVCRNVKELILQPQSELERVRRFLWENGYVTDAEEMVEEEGKYYPMMRVHYEPTAENGSGGEMREVDFAYGKLLLERQHPVLKQYLCWERQLTEQILDQLKQQPGSEGIAKRIQEKENVLARNREALTYF